MNPGGTLLALLAVVALAQVTLGGALERLGIIPDGNAA